MDTVFALPELLEPILEYCGAGEPFQNTLKLRLVCKGFKENVFKGLCESEQVPEETFPVSDTSKVACQRFVPPFIQRSYIPVKVKFSGEVTSGGLRSIADHPMSITSIEILGKHRYHGPVDLSIEAVSTSDHLTFQLPFLRQLVISCAIRTFTCDTDIEAFLRLVQVANKIARSSPHLKKFSIFLELQTTRTSTIVLPVGVTHLVLSGTNHTGILGVFNSNKTLRNLTGLTLYLKDVFEYNDGWNKLSLVWPRLNPVLATWGPALKSLSVGYNDGPSNTQGYLELPEMNQLEKLYFGNDEAWPQRYPISQVMPNLKELRCDYHEIRRFRLTRSFFQHVKILKLCGVIFREGCTGQEFHDMIASVFSVCPSIESFDWSVELQHLGMHSLLQLFASSMHRLKHLKLWLFGLNKRDRINCGTDFPPGIHRDLLGLLTGLTEACIPSDESTWSELLQHCPNSITNLHRLQSLKIVCDWRPHWKADRFLFNAAFFQMKSLNNLQLTRIDVPDCTITAWKETNRSISFPHEFWFG